MHVKLSHYK